MNCIFCGNVLTDEDYDDPKEEYCNSCYNMLLWDVDYDIIMDEEGY